MAFQSSDFMFIDKPICRRQNKFISCPFKLTSVPPFYGMLCKIRNVFYVKNVCQKVYKLLLCFLLGMVMFFS